jgi:hypothetical protein
LVSLYSILARALAIELGGYNAHPKWPVDMDFWMRFFAKVREGNIVAFINIRCE